MPHQRDLKYRNIYTKVEVHDELYRIRHIELDKTKRGKPIVMLPGIGGFCESYLWNMYGLYEKGYWPLAVDHLGFGLSAKPQQMKYEIDCFSLAISQWIERNKLRNVTLIGNSFGGGISLGVWEFCKERITKLILVSSAGFGQELNFSYRFASLPIINQILTSLIINRYIPINNGRGAWKSIIHNPANLPDEFIMLSDFYKDNHEVRAAYSYILRNMISLRGQPQKLNYMIRSISDDIRMKKIPVLIIWGKNDPVIPVFHGQNAAKLTNGKLVVFDNCGHMPYIEKVDEFNNSVVTFLNSSE